MRTCWMLRQSALNVSGNRSVIPPGMFAGAVQRDARRDTRSLHFVGDAAGAGRCSRSGVTMFLPDARSWRISPSSASIGEYTTASASIAQISSRLRRRHAGRADARDLAGVATDLLFAVHPTPDELELGVRNDALDRFLADESGRPLDHFVRHGSKLPIRGTARLEARRAG